jgi:diaminopimelate epimerase
MDSIDLQPFRFYKYHGTGNDFIVADNRNGHYKLSAEQVKLLCDRHFGIGADGLILIEKSRVADFKMIYYNADGFEGSMCGNGGRCAVAYARLYKITGNSAVFEAYDGLHKAQIISSNDRVTMVELGMSDVKHWHIDENHLLVDTGSPHYVCNVEDLQMMDIVARGRQIRHDKTVSSEGVNVNFLEKSGNTFQLRTYERGVENETLSCGTGVTAAAIAANLWYGGNDFEIKTKGGMLTVTFEKSDETFTNIVLSGPAELVFSGAVNLSK